MDGDALLDVEEAAIGTNALNPDTDGDGFDDGQEVLVMGTDPLDPLDPTPESRAGACCSAAETSTDRCSPARSQFPLPDVPFPGPFQPRTTAPPTGLEPVWFVREVQRNQAVSGLAEVEKPPHARPTRHI